MAVEGDRSKASWSHIVLRRHSADMPRRQFENAAIVSVIAASVAIRWKACHDAAALRMSSKFSEREPSPCAFPNIFYRF